MQRVSLTNLGSEVSASPPPANSNIELIERFVYDD